MKNHARLQLRHRVGVFQVRREAGAVRLGNQGETLARLEFFGGSVLCERGQFGDRGMLEKLGQREVNSLRARARESLDAPNGVAAQFKKTVARPDAFEAERLLPDLRERGLARVRRRRAGLRQLRARAAGFGQGRAIHLSVQGERKMLQEDESRRDHLRREFPRQPFPQRGDGHRFLGHDIGDQLWLIAFAAGVGHAFAHGRMLQEGGFDFAQLDAEAANLHLEVFAAEVFQFAGGGAAREVAGTVQAATARDWMGREFLGGQVRPV